MVCVFLRDFRQTSIDRKIVCLNFDSILRVLQISTGLTSIQYLAVLTKSLREMKLSRYKLLSMGGHVACIL